MFASRKWTDRMTINSKSARQHPDSYFRRIVPAASPAGRSWQLARSPRATQLTPLSVTCYQTTTNRANSGYAQVRAVVSRTRGDVHRQRLDRCHYWDRGHAVLPRTAGSAYLFERLRSSPTNTPGELRQGPIRQPIAARFASSFPFKSRHQERPHCLSRRRLPLPTAFDA